MQKAQNLYEAAVFSDADLTRLAAGRAEVITGRGDTR
jgi:hypothetical protein